MLRNGREWMDLERTSANIIESVASGETKTSEKNLMIGKDNCMIHLYSDQLSYIIVSGFKISNVCAQRETYALIQKYHINWQVINYNSMYILSVIMSSPPTMRPVQVKMPWEWFANECGPVPISLYGPIYIPFTSPSKLAP